MSVMLVASSFVTALPIPAEAFTPAVGDQISPVFACTRVVNIIERPDGIKIAGFFIALIIFVSLLEFLASS
jgi:hypothetical protein